MPLLFLQTCWVVLTTEGRVNAGGARERLWWLLKPPLSQFIFGLSERSFIVNGNGSPLPRKQSTSVPGRMNGELTPTFFHRSNNREMLEKASYTTCDENRALWGMVLWTQASQRNKDTSVPSRSFYLTAPRAAQGNKWLLATNSLVYWASNSDL